MTALAYDNLKTQGFKLSGNIGGKNVYRKELIYTGHFVKKTPQKEQRFSVTEDDLTHWVETGVQMLSNGIEIPLPLEHTENPEAKRGDVVGFETGINDKGLPALYGLCTFVDADAEKLAASANCSIYVPEDFTDGKGNTYERPVRHVALTNYPVIPGLAKFETIALSLLEPTGENEMPLKELAKAVGVEVQDGADDATIEKAIATSFGTMRKELDDLKKKSKTDPPADPKPADKPPVKIAAGFLSMARDNRTLKLDALVKAGNITPATRDKLAAQYVTDDALTLSLSSEEGDADGFDTMVAALGENDPVQLAEQSGPQLDGEALTLSEVGDPKKNPMLAEAQARANAAAS